MQGKQKLAFYVILVMFVAFIGLRAIDFFISRGEVRINNTIFKVEVVNSPKEMQKGLGGRKSLKDDKGMLFVFEEAGRHEFWMKNMRFPIDIIWINNGEIVDIEHFVPIPDSDRLISYIPRLPSVYVLEINAGLSEKYGFKVGDDILLDI